MIENAALQPGDTVDLEIIDLAFGGDSVARHNGLTVFIPYGVPGDRVKARVREVKKNYAKAEIVAVVTLSPDRQEPACPYFGICGGCQIMNLLYEKQLEYKLNALNNSIRRIAGIENLKVKNIKGYSTPYFYRDRAQYKLAQAAEGFDMGFYKAGSHDVVDVEKCCIQKEILNDIMAGAKQYIADNRKKSLSIYNEKKNDGTLRYLAARVNSAGEALFTVITPEDGRNASIEAFAKHMKQNFAALKGVLININALPGNRVFGGKEYLLQGVPVITEIIRGITFELGPDTFFQVNKARLEDMLVFMERHIPEGDSVVDLYAGVGALSLPFHKKFKKLKAVEVFYKSIESFNKAALKNKIANAEMIKAAAEDAADEVITEGKTGTVIVDPPRKGLDKKVITALLKKKIKNLIYISCDPATYARNLKELSAVYAVKDIMAVDMFPQTYHVETLSVLAPK